VEKKPVLLNLIFMYFFNSKKDLIYFMMNHLISQAVSNPFLPRRQRMNHGTIQQRQAQRFIMSVYAGCAGPWRVIQFIP